MYKAAIDNRNQVLTRVSVFIKKEGVFVEPMILYLRTNIRSSLYKTDIVNIILIS